MELLRGFITGLILGVLIVFAFKYYSDDGSEYTREDMIIVMEDVANRSVGPDEFYVGSYNVDWLYYQYNGKEFIQHHEEWTIDEYLELILKKESD